VWVATQPVDMRKSFDGLAEHVRAFLGHDPLSGSMSSATRRRIG
jgi:transposase